MPQKTSSGPVKIAALAATFLATCSLQTARAESWRLSIHGALPARGETPIVTRISELIPPGTYETIAEEPLGSTPVQIFDDSNQRWLALVLPAGVKEGVYTLRPLAARDGDAQGGFSVEAHASRIPIQLDHALLTEYRTDEGAKPFLFPLIGPTGASYTRAYPMTTIAGEDHDHPHQRSFWFTHGKVNGVDFWSEQKGHGTIRETARPTLLAGPVLARLRTTDDWIAPDGKKVCEDERVLTLTRTKSARVFDFEITLKATNGPVVFGDTKEGMFGLRVASSMDANEKRGGKITNAEGLTNDRAWGKASPWVDYTGSVEGKQVGIAILNHPQSFRFPTTWHVRTYGLFAANPFGWHDFGLGKSGEYTLAAGQRLRFGYRVILHAGDTASAHIADAFAGYSDPPRIEVLAN